MFLFIILPPDKNRWIMIILGPGWYYFADSTNHWDLKYSSNVYQQILNTHVLLINTCISSSIILLSLSILMQINHSQHTMKLFYQQDLVQTSLEERRDHPPCGPWTIERAESRQWRPHADASYHDWILVATCCLDASLECGEYFINKCEIVDKEGWGMMKDHPRNSQTCLEYH